MAGILVYLPGYTGSDRQELVRRGLGALLDPGIDAIFGKTTKGPDDGAGAMVVFCGPVPMPPPAYGAESQTWLEAPPDGAMERGRYWLGYVNTQKPSAGELQRVNLIDGEPVALADGNAWVIPCCEYAPKRLTRNRDTGDETRVVADEHQTWVDWSNALYRLFVSDGFRVLVEKDRVVHIPNGLGYAALCLSKNYRVNMDAVDLLGLIGEYEAFEIARVATGMSVVERLLTQKKSTVNSYPQPALN